MLRPRRPVPTEACLLPAGRNFHYRTIEIQNKIVHAGDRTAYSLSEPGRVRSRRSPKASGGGGRDASGEAPREPGSPGRAGAGAGCRGARPGARPAAVVRDLRDRPPRVRAWAALHAGREPAAGDRPRVLRGDRRDRPGGHHHAPRRPRRRAPPRLLRRLFLLPPRPAGAVLEPEADGGDVALGWPGRPGRRSGVAGGRPARRGVV